MKQKIGIGLLIALNLTFISVIIFQTRLSFALIVAPLGEEMGKEVANQLSFEFLIKFAAIALLVFLFNYLLFNKMVSNTRPLISSIIISIIGVFVFIPLLISEKQSFINYQNGTTALRHYLKKDKITEALVVISTDSIKVVKLDNFIRDIGYAKYKRGLWKYQKKM